MNSSMDILLAALKKMPAGQGSPYPVGLSMRRRCIHGLNQPLRPLRSFRHVGKVGSMVRVRLDGVTLTNMPSDTASLVMRLKTLCASFVPPMMSISRRLALSE